MLGVAKEFLQFYLKYGVLAGARQKNPTTKYPATKDPATKDPEDKRPRDRRPHRQNIPNLIIPR